MIEFINMFWDLLKIIIFVPYIVIAYGTIVYIWFRIFVRVRRPIQRISDRYYGGDSDNMPFVLGPWISFFIAFGMSFLIIMFILYLGGAISGNFAIFLLFIYGLYLIIKKLKQGYEG